MIDIIIALLRGDSPLSRTNPNAWHNYYHCVGSTYGTWLRGDPRGFRTQRHMQHVDGDYKQPPPDIYKPLFEYNKKNLKYPPVKLSQDQQRILCRAIVGSLQDDNALPVVLAIAVNHFHLLARFTQMSPELIAKHKSHLLADERDPSPRFYLGRARQVASFALAQQNLKPPSAVWASRPTCKPVRSREHQLAVARYIKAHVREGAAVWHINDGFLFER
ncbi:MAG TPA: hypothetical protein DCM28_07815 [Phycisphaerales bacterium]|nr:hypothetical protein [Phycisphaerales bacterium]HCD32185.1 hypothetical protein [Phycisphaerales bacterium]